MQQSQFVNKSVYAALKNKGYPHSQATKGAEVAEEHYRTGSNFKPNVVDACLNHALSSIGKPQR